MCSYNGERCTREGEVDWENREGERQMWMSRATPEKD